MLGKRSKSYSNNWKVCKRIWSVWKEIMKSRWSQSSTWAATSVKSERVWRVWRELRNLDGKTREQMEDPLPLLYPLLSASWSLVMGLMGLTDGYGQVYGLSLGGVLLMPSHTSRPITLVVVWWLDWLPSCVSTFLSSCLSAFVLCLPVRLSSCLLLCVFLSAFHFVSFCKSSMLTAFMLSSCLPSILPAFVFHPVCSYLSSWMPSILPAFVSVFHPACFCIFLPVCLPSCLLYKLVVWGVKSVLE